MLVLVLLLLSVLFYLLLSLHDSYVGCVTSVCFVIARTLVLSLLSVLSLLLRLLVLYLLLSCTCRVFPLAPLPPPSWMLCWEVLL